MAWYVNRFTSNFANIESSPQGTMANRPRKNSKIVRRAGSGEIQSYIIKKIAKIDMLRGGF